MRMTLNFGLDVSFVNMWNWEGKLEKAVEGNSRKVYMKMINFPLNS
jgi:O-acetylhomoserine/O-acetylserine sulfhydrylase-like pyridoxal-dependent enzyme